MLPVLYAALAIGAATVFGALLGCAVGQLPARVDDWVNSLAAGVMLCAAMMGLVIPSAELSMGSCGLMTVLGIFCGAAFLSRMNALSPRILHACGVDDADDAKNRTAMFVLAIAIHHFPEGLAAGVSFGTGDLSESLTVCAGIAIQNIPEAMIIIPAMFHVGASRKTAFLIAILSGCAEAAGTFLGYFAVTLVSAVLPLLLAFAAGTMMFVIVDDIVPNTHTGKHSRMCTYGVLLGFCVMLCINCLIDKIA
ncbi:MAG: ZIP family metal transporter [Oscillospiraceae bacterium]|nr:ZIP family metal transporter [Oscillospiraceae bacterium]